MYIQITDNLKIKLDVFLKLYVSLQKLYDSHLQLAKRSNKKLLIIVGEIHDSPYSFLIKAITFNIAKKMGLNSLYYEISPAALNNKRIYKALGIELCIKGIRNIIDWKTKSSLSLTNEALKTIQDEINGLNEPELFARTLKCADSSGLNIIGIDEVADTNKSLLNQRDNAFDTGDRNLSMCEKLTSYDESGVLVTGSHHLKGLMENASLHEAYHILPLNATCIHPEEEQKDIDKNQVMLNDLDSQNNKTFGTETIRNIVDCAKFSISDGVIQLPYTEKDFLILNSDLDFTFSVEPSVKASCSNILECIKQPSFAGILFDYKSYLSNSKNLLEGACCKRTQKSHTK